MRQCIWKGMPIIGTYGGRVTIFPTPETCSKIKFLIGFKESKKMTFFNKLTRLQQVGSVEEFRHQCESLSK